LRFAGRAYRAIDPRWSFGPLSGDGAALRGARFNPPGVPALYLSLDAIGAVNEVAQGFAGRIPPTVLCEYDIDCEDVVDLRDATSQQAAGTSLDVLSCAWKLASPAPSQQLAARLIGEGAAGILVQSFAIGAPPQHANLVLWKWGADLPWRVEVFDPSGRLPKNQLSWS
jgi:RES domain-containing protein